MNCPKSVSSTHSVDQMKKKAKIWCFTSLHLYNILNNGLSIWETFDW